MNQIDNGVLLDDESCLEVYSSRDDIGNRGSWRDDNDLDTV